MKRDIVLLILIFLFSIPGVSFGQVIVTAAGTGSSGYSGDGGPARRAQLNEPFGIALDDSGNLYICDEFNWRIRKVSPGYGGTITTIAGNGFPGYSGDGGLGIHASISSVYYIATDHHGNVYIPDVNNSRIRKITPGDTITTIAGTGVAGYNGDSILATTAELNWPQGIAIDDTGNIYISDWRNYRIRKIDTSGIITTVVGKGVQGFSPDGSRADTAMLDSLYGLAIGPKGVLYFIDNIRIRKLDTSGTITTVAGTGIPGFSGDGGPAIAAEIAGFSIAVDDTGNIYLASEDNARVRKIDTSGIIRTIAGTGSRGGYGGEGGDPLLAAIGNATGIAVNDSGEIYISLALDRICLITKHPDGVNNVALNSGNVTVYPNPSHGAFTIMVPSGNNEQVAVRIVNVLGEEVKKFSLRTNEKTTITTGLLPGMYYLSAVTAHGTYNKTIVVLSP